MTTQRVLAVVASLAIFALLPLPVHADLFGRNDADAPAEAPVETPGAADSGDAQVETQAEVAGAPALTAEALVAALPRSWHGTFVWDGGVAYFVEMEIVKLTVRPDGDVAFNAETLWLPDELRARMSGRIDPVTLEVRIWEIADDAGADEFENDGSYLGAFAPDLWDLRARWSTTGTGEAGDLVLITTSTPDPVE